MCEVAFLQHLCPFCTVLVSVPDAASANHVALRRFISAQVCYAACVQHLCLLMLSLCPSKICLSHTYIVYISKQGHLPGHICMHLCSLMTNPSYTIACGAAWTSVTASPVQSLFVFLRLSLLFEGSLIEDLESSTNVACGRNYVCSNAHKGGPGSLDLFLFNVADINSFVCSDAYTHQTYL